MVSTFRDAGTRCVHVVNVSTVMRRNDGRWTGESAQRFNEMAAALAEADDAVVVVDWNGAVVAAEERGESLVADTVHPNGAGAETLATLVAASLDRGCPGGS
jgi:lysophospholipase L1-like esterase